MKKSIPKTKLTINKDTLLRLVGGSLGEVVGGAGSFGPLGCAPVTVLGHTVCKCL